MKGYVLYNNIAAHLWQHADPPRESGIQVLSPSLSPTAQFHSGTYFSWKEWVIKFAALVGLNSSKRVIRAWY